MDDLGLGPDVLLEANPKLVYAAATGFGVDGPDRDQLAMDLTIQAYTGVMSVTGFPDQPPVKAGVAFTDILGGTHLYAGIVTALFERERTGCGRVVDVAMADAIYPTLASNMSGWYRDGVAGRSGNGHGGGALAPYNVYATSDGYVAIIVITEAQWLGLCAAMDRPELADDERFRSFGRRFYNIDEIDAIVGEWTHTLPRDEIVALCRRHKVPAAAVRDVGEVVEDRHLHERRALQRVTQAEIGVVVVPASPLRFRGTPVPTLEPSPALGADNETVYRDWLGMSTQEIDGLRDAGVI
jgi:crotonobetainyl-CoA:carnitine CoA-transferase CaiB-like acyl-CoA transferase